MPPKGVSKAVSKRCPECKKQLPVATRHCACGHQFFEERRRSSSALTPPQDTGPDIEEITPVPVQHSSKDYVTPGVLQHSAGEGRHTGATELPVAATMLVAAAKAGANGAVGSGVPAERGKRRSERVKREKPNFYDALEYDNQMRKARRERQKDEPQPQTSTSGRAKRERRTRNSSPDEEEEEEPVVKEKKRRKKKKKVKKEEEEEDEDIMAGISPYRELSFAYVLADINLKLGLNNPTFT